MRKLINSFGIQGAAALAVVVTSSLTNMRAAQAEEPVTQKVFVVTSDDDDDDEGGEKNKFTFEVVKGSNLWLGIMLKDVEGDLARYLGSEEGILVDSVIEDSPAAKAGIKEGDILLSVGETKLTEPQELMKIMAGLDKEGASLKIALLRQGEEKTVEVVPSARPETEEIVVHELEDLHLDLKDAEEAGEAVKKALRQLRVGELDKDMNILRFGNPSMVFRGRDKSTTVDGDLEAIIIREVDGDKIEVKVVRKDDKPATVTVTKGDEVTEYTQENLKEMPEEIAVIVEPMIDGKAGLHIGNFHIVGPKWTEGVELGELNRDEIAKKAREMAARGREMADKGRALAAESVDKARLGERLRIAGGSEVKELKAMIDELRQEVDKLRAELKDKN